MAYTGTSIVDYLKSIGKPSSYTDRTNLYYSTFGKGTQYKGTAEQNLSLLDKLRTQSAPVVPADTALPATGVTTPEVPNVNVTPEVPAATGAGAAIPGPTFTTQWDATQLELINKLLNPVPYQYNYMEDPAYQSYKNQFERQGQTAFTNTLAQVSGMSRGQPNSWAVSAASQARQGWDQKLMDVIPLLEERAYGRHMDEYSQIAEQLGLIQNLRAEDIGMQESAFQREIDTLGQYYSDFQKEINRRTTTPETSDDTLIPYLRAAREEKIASMNAAKADAERQAYEDDIARQEFELERAYKMGSLSVDQYNAETARLKAMTSTGGTPSITGSDLTKLGTPEQIKNYKAIKDRLMEKYKTNPSEALRFIVSQDDERTGRYSNMMGGLLYQRLLNDFGNKTAGDYDYRDDPGYMEDLMQAKQFAQDDNRAMYDDINTNWRDYYAAYGYNGLKELLKAANPDLSDMEILMKLNEWITEATSS